MIALFLKALFWAEQNDTINNQELLLPIHFLKRSGFYIARSQFDITIDNHVLQYFFRKVELSRRKARWIQVL